MLLDPLLEQKAPFTTYFAAIVFTAWYAGLGPSLAVIVSSGILGAYFFAAPRGSLAIADAEHLVSLGLFVFVGLAIVLFTELRCREILRRKRAEEALQREQRTLKHLLRASDHERQLIAYEIHDDLAQQLAGAIMQFETYPHQKEAKPDEATKVFDVGMSVLRQAHSEVRRLVAGVRPPILDDEGVLAAIGHLVHEQEFRDGTKIEFHSEVQFDRLVPILENAIYRIVQEGLANACQHSNSQKVEVELVQYGDELRIGIQDWGVGFDPKVVQDGHFGLEGIRQRARLLGGNVTVESAPGHGTCITVELPVLAKD